MKRTLLRIFVFALILCGLYFSIEFYNQYQDHLRRKAYEESLVDTSSPTVKVLRDSILIDYQNTKRTLHVYVPPNYDSDTLKRYPVIYMLDGESSFNDMENMSPEWEIDEVINRASKNDLQTAIVIGVNQAEDRDAEYSPFVTDDVPNAHGDKFSQWLVTDLKKWVDSNYRTQPASEKTTIGGISRSGMMAYYILMEYPNVFGNAIIQSPSMWVDYDKLMGMSLTEDQLLNKKIFVSVGAKEGGNMVPHAKDVYKKFKARGLDEKRLRFEIIPDEGHWHMTWRKSFALAYPWIMD